VRGPVGSGQEAAAARREAGRVQAVEPAEPAPLTCEEGRAARAGVLSVGGDGERDAEDVREDLITNKIKNQKKKT